jgi:hypothetical protein
MGLLLVALFLLSRNFQGPLIPLEIGAVAGEAGGEAGAGGLGGLGGLGKDFNDLPFGKIAGQIGGKLVHAITGTLGTPGGFEHENIGSVGNLAK